MKLRISPQHLVTILAGVFALVSVQNIAHFFIDLKHPTVASWTLGLAIGTALVVLAHLLSEINTRETKAFAGLLTVTLILVALSGLIQGNAYSHSLGNMGYLLAFVMAATGEIVLPLAHSWHRDAQRRQAVHDAGQQAESLAAQTLVNVIASVDMAQAQAKAERRIEQLVLAHVDHIVRRLMPVTANLDGPRALPDKEASIDGLSSEGLHIADAGNNNEEQLEISSEASGRNEDQDSDEPLQRFGPHNLPSANQARAEALSERQTQLLALLQTEYKGKPVDTLNRAAIGRRFDVSGKTIGRDLEALEESGVLSMNGVVQVNH